MAYVVIEDFRAGLDTRKMPEASPPGSLQVLSNAHISRGGEIEKRKAWVRKLTLPAGKTFGLAGANGTLYTFGSLGSVSVPSGITYQRLQHPSGYSMSKIIDAEFYDGKLFVGAQFSDGSTRCFYDGARVTDWDPTSGVVAIAGQPVTSILTAKSKVYATSSSLLNFSAVDAPKDWGGGSGSGDGFINMSNQAAGSEKLTGLGRYMGYLAVFARRSTQIWFVDPDPAQNAQKQVLYNIGTFARKSIVSFGDIDVFFLSDTGIRSLRSRDSQANAGVSDVGTPIDDQVKATIKTLAEDAKADVAAILEPQDGRYIISIGTTAYVFSYFSSARISAWSSYDLGMTFSDFVAMDDKLWARSGDKVYLYGGDDGETYDDCEVAVELPYIDASTIATWKQWNGLDIVCEGEWKVYANTNPLQPDAWSELGIITNTTLGIPDIGMVGHATMVKLKLVNQRAGAARLSKIVMHYESTEAA